MEAPTLCAIANGSRAARVCIGSDNPDNLYENATIDGSLEYVVRGSRGTVAYLGFGTQSGQYGKAGGLQTVDYIEANALVYDGLPKGKLPAADSMFTIVLSAERPTNAPNWLRLKPEPREAMCIVRQTFGDRSKEVAARVTIERRVGSGSFVDGGRAMAAKPPLLTCEKLDDGLQSAAVLVAGASAMFAKWAHGFQGHCNALPLFDQQKSNNAGGDPNIRYFHSYWRLGEGEALVIRAKPPPCRCWNFQLNNHWMESLDYRHHQVHTNNVLATPDLDGTGWYTIIVSHEDPNAKGFRGVWIETVGHTCGTMCFRWVAPQVGDDELPHPRIELVPFVEVLR